MDFKTIELIIYVADQAQSTEFYEQLLNKKPVLNVPGMTEFELAPNCKLGLMPNHGIAKIIHPIMPHPQDGHGIPRCELYLYVDDLNTIQQQAKDCNAKLISALAVRNWGDKVVYYADLDGHIIAFAQKA